MEKGGKTQNRSSSDMSVEEFVSRMAPLIDMEKEAEISMSISSSSSSSLDAMQKRGSVILNLKCIDAQTGLMGKTLLEFQSTKGDVLPTHKFGTHDVVILKPNKADSGSASLGQGVVYRLKDTSITVAFDDIPEDGLNNPMRLEKVANEDLKTGRTIGSGLEDRGLYRLNLGGSITLQSTTTRSIASKMEEIRLWHCHLRHLSITSLRVLFPSLFHSVSIEAFYYSVYQLAKHCRTNYSDSIEKSNAPFELIHSDVWAHPLCALLMAFGTSSLLLMISPFALGFIS